MNELLDFIRTHRSNEANFEQLHQRLLQWTKNNGSVSGLEEMLARAEEYKKAKENAASAWPEFEKFVSDFERLALEKAEETE